MKRVFWSFKLGFWIKHYGYEKTYFKAVLFALQDCWTDYYNEKYNPKDAILEDMSYA